MIKLTVGAIYICDVRKLLQHGIIVGIDDSDKEGFVHISELSKRWVKNVKDVARQGERIVCKLIKLEPQSIELSAKRVTDNEKKQALKEWSISTRTEKIIEKIAGKGAQELIKKIKDEYGSLYDFYSAVLRNGKPTLKNMELSKTAIEELLDFVEKTKKRITIKTDLFIRAFNEDGVESIKNLLIKNYTNDKDYSIKYIKAPHYLLSVNASDTKKTLSENKKILEGLEAESKKLGIEFTYKEIKE
jgi:translation initiation factor 2 subunit 1